MQPKRVRKTVGVTTNNMVAGQRGYSQFSPRGYDCSGDPYAVGVSIDLMRISSHALSIKETFRV